jgi:hypothetical protein
MYSVREKGRARIRGSALLDRSGAMSPGPTMAVRNIPRPVWIARKYRKKSALMGSRSRMV